MSWALKSRGFHNKAAFQQTKVNRKDLTFARNSGIIMVSYLPLVRNSSKYASKGKLLWFAKPYCGGNYAPNYIEPMVRNGHT